MIRLTEADLSDIIMESVMRIVEAGDQGYEGPSREDMARTSDELDANLESGQGLDALTEKIGTVVSNVERKFEEAVAYKKEAAKELSAAVAEYSGVPVVIYAKAKEHGPQYASGNYRKFPAKLTKMDFFGDNIYLRFENLAQDGRDSSISNRSYDFSTLRIIPMKEGEEGKFSNGSPWGYYGE